MKKLFSVLAVLFVLGTVNVFALGIGPQGGYTVSGAGGGTTNGAVTFKIDGVPCVFALTVDGIGAVTSVGLTADWWIANPKIEQTWGYFYGVGLAGSFIVTKNYSGMFFGGRAVLGTNVFLLNNFIEPYIQIAWQPGVSIGGDQITPVLSSFPLNIGLRFWF